MDESRKTQISKYLAKYLRHHPRRLGLSLGPGGWVAVDDLLRACAAHRFPITRAELDEVVRDNAKQRFSIDAGDAALAGDEGRARIRANQGHSVAVDLQLPPLAPPAVLYHGTGAGSVAAILAGGVHKMSRHHVHLSPDPETARAVGARHGRPVVFAVDAAAMAQAGHLFYRSDNGVWLTDHVPAAYLRQGDSPSG